MDFMIRSLKLSVSLGTKMAKIFEPPLLTKSSVAPPFIEIGILAKKFKTKLTHLIRIQIFECNKISYIYHFDREFV